MKSPQPTMTPEEEVAWAVQVATGGLRRRPSRPRVPRLSLQEARIVQELSHGPATTMMLADAIGQLDQWPASKFRIHASIQHIRRKYGPKSIRTRPGGGYELGVEL